MIRELTIKGKVYVIEFVRDSVRAYEAAGYSMMEIQNKPFSSLDGMMYAALWKHNKAALKNITQVVDDACEEYGSEALLEFLSEELMSVFTSGGAKKKPLPWKAKVVEIVSSEAKD